MCLISCSPSSIVIKRTGERGDGLVSRGGARSDRGRGRGKGPTWGGKKEPTKIVEPKKYEEPEVKVRQNFCKCATDIRQNIQDNWLLLSPKHCKKSILSVVLRYWSKLRFFDCGSMFSRKAR